MHTRISAHRRNLSKHGPNNRSKRVHTEAKAEAKAELSVAAHLVQSQGTQNRSLPVSSATMNFTPGVPI